MTEWLTDFTRRSSRSRSFSRGRSCSHRRGRRRGGVAVVVEVVVVVLAVVVVSETALELEHKQKRQRRSVNDWNYIMGRISRLASYMTCHGSRKIAGLQMPFSETRPAPCVALAWQLRSRSTEMLRRPPGGKAGPSEHPFMQGRQSAARHSRDGLTTVFFTTAP